MAGASVKVCSAVSTGTVTKVTSVCDLWERYEWIGLETERQCLCISVMFKEEQKSNSLRWLEMWLQVVIRTVCRQFHTMGSYRRAGGHETFLTKMNGWFSFQQGSTEMWKNGIWPDESPFAWGWKIVWIICGGCHSHHILTQLNTYGKFWNDVVYGALNRSQTGFHKLNVWLVETITGAPPAKISKDHKDPKASTENV